MITEEQLAKERVVIPFTSTKRLMRDDVLYVVEKDIPHPIYGYSKYHKEYSIIDLRGYRRGYEPRLDIRGIYTPNPTDTFRLQDGHLPPYQPTTTGDKLLAEMRRLGVHKAFRIDKPSPMATGGNPEEVPAVPEVTTELDRAAVDLFIERHGREAYERGEIGETLERIDQRVEEYDPAFLSKHPELKGESITVYHDPLRGEDLAVINTRTGEVVEVLSDEFRGRLAKPPTVVPAILELEDVGREWDKLTRRQRQPIVERANLPSSFAIRDWAELPLSKKDAIRMNFREVPAVPEVEIEARIKYFRQQEAKWRETAYKIAEEERGEAEFATAIRKADEFGAKASELEVAKKEGNPMRTETQRKSFHERIFGKGSTPPLERLGKGETLNNLLPMPPEEGPPLPRMFALKWPWKK